MSLRKGSICEEDFPVQDSSTYDCCKTRGKSAVSVALDKQEVYAGPKRLFGGVRYLGVLLKCPF